MNRRGKKIPWPIEKIIFLTELRVLWKKIFFEHKDPKAIEDSASTSDAAMG